MGIEFIKNLKPHHRHSVYLLLFLCAVNVAIVLLALLNMALKWNHPFLDIELDRSLAECFQYAEEICIALILLGLSVRRRGSGVLLWGLLYVYLFFDDAFSIHESVGEYLANVFEFSTNTLRPQDIGEMIVSASVGLFFFVSLALNYLLKQSSNARAVTHDLICLLGLLVFFGVFVDMLHVVFDGYWWLYVVFSMIEESGELFSFSLILVYVYQLGRSQGGEELHVVNTIVLRIYRAHVAAQRE